MKQSLVVACQCLTYFSYNYYHSMIMKITYQFLRYIPTPLIFWLLLSIGSVSCQEDEANPEEEAHAVWVLDRLYFGRAMPNGEEVSEQAWDQFVDEIITPRFPDGMTLWHAEGQWRDASGVIIEEATFVLEVAHEKSEADEQKLDEIIETYKEHFQQESVLRITEQIEVTF